MIIEAVSIILVILLVANIAVGVFNSAYPPCDDIDEYFESARKISKDSMTGLRTVQSGTDINYVGAKLSTNESGDVVLKSRNEDYNTPPNPHSSKDLMNAISIALGEHKGVKHQEASTTKREHTSGPMSAIFETEFEGLHANNIKRKADPRDIMKPTGFVHSIEQEGYSGRKVNEW